MNTIKRTIMCLCAAAISAGLAGAQEQPSRWIHYSAPHQGFVFYLEHPVGKTVTITVHARVAGKTVTTTHEFPAREVALLFRMTFNEGDTVLSIEITMGDQCDSREAPKLNTYYEFAGCLSSAV